MKNMTKRKAIDCKLVRPSASNPGYFKYEITIQEKDGTTSSQPAYGKDMQDAIGRLIWNERVERVATKTNNNIEYGIMTVLVIICIVGPAILSSTQDTPLFSVAGIVLALTSGTAIYWFNKWLSKQ